MSFTPDSTLALGEVTGNDAVATRGRLTNNAAYAEFLAPLYDNSTQNVYLKGGLRYDDWSLFGALCAFLCNQQAAYITAQNILMDGGVYPGTL